MSTQRYISTSFWDDDWIRTLNPNEKFLYLYLMTNTLTNIAGVYKITIDRMSFDTGFNKDAIGIILSKFKSSKKCFYFNGWIVLPSWPKHQKWQNKKTIKEGIDKCLFSTPKDIISLLLQVGYQYPIDTNLYDIHTVQVPTPTADYRPSYLNSDLEFDLDKDTDTSHSTVPKIETPQEPDIRNDSPFGPDDYSNAFPPDEPQEPQEFDDIPDDEPTPAQKLELAREYWQDKKVTPECRLPALQWPPAKSADAVKGVSVYKFFEIKDAINNFKVIQDNKDSYEQFEYGCEGFLAKGISRYLTSANPFTTFLKPGAKKVTVRSKPCPNCGSIVQANGGLYICENCGYDTRDELEAFKIMKYGTDAEKEQLRKDTEAGFERLKAFKENMAKGM